MDLMRGIFEQCFWRNIAPTWMPSARPGQEESARVMMRMQLASTSGEPTPAPLAALHSGLLQHGHQSEASGGRPPANHSSPAVAELVAGVGPVAVGLARHVARPLGRAAAPRHLAICTTLASLGGADNVGSQLSS